ncbi:MAG: hypothetical protein CM15mV108_190 [uncultured marine virus]|nr:MAG: hypothetical protein CM15mV108_190 [uncultured marine virus]
MVDSLRGLFTIDSLNVYNMHLYFVVFKNKKDNDYKLFNNTLFDDEKKAEHFGKTSMKRGFEHKVLEYNSENYDRFWNEQKR